MRNYPHPIIAREGWPVLVIAVSVTVLMAQGSVVWSIPFWIAAVLFLQFFRDPARAVPKNANAVLSPADGRIVVMEKAQDPYVGCEALKMSVFMNIFNVRSNRAPVDGKVEIARYLPGKFVHADRGEVSPDGDRNAVVITTCRGDAVTCVQRAGVIARRVLCYVKAGDMLARGQRYGFIRFGSRVDVYLPLHATLRVTVGDRVFASETILAEL